MPKVNINFSPPLHAEPVILIMLLLCWIFPPLKYSVNAVAVPCLGSQGTLILVEAVHDLPCMQESRVHVCHPTWVTLQSPRHAAPMQPELHHLIV